MIRKRRSLSGEGVSAADARVSRARVGNPPIRKKGVSAVRGVGESGGLSKRELIESYAFTWRQRDSASQMRTWVIVSVFIAVVVTGLGWWMVFGRAVLHDSRGSVGLFQQVRDRSQVLREDVGPLPVTPSLRQEQQSLVLPMEAATGTVVEMATGTQRGASTSSRAP